MSNAEIARYCQACSQEYPSPEDRCVQCQRYIGPGSGGGLAHFCRECSWGLSGPAKCCVQCQRHIGPGATMVRYCGTCVQADYRLTRECIGCKRNI